MEIFLAVRKFLFFFVNERFSIEFLAGSTFNITHIPTEPTIFESNETGVGNFDITMDDFFAASQSSPTLQLNDVKSQSTNVFPMNNDDLDDEELLDAFNKQIETTREISPVLVLTNRVATQHQPATNSLPKFDLEFSFDDFDNDEEKATNVLETYV